MKNRIFKLLLKRFGKGFVLVTHGVIREPINNFVTNFPVGLSEFVENITTLKKFDYDFISMEKLITISKYNFSYPKHWVHLSFDDGYINNLSIVAPYLKSQDIPWSLFIPTNHIQNNERLYSYRIRCSILHTSKEVVIPHSDLKLDSAASIEKRTAFNEQVCSLFKSLSKRRALEIADYCNALLTQGEWERLNIFYKENSLLTTEQLKNLIRENNVYIGSHSHNHVVLNPRCSIKDLEYEMQTSKEWIEHTLNAKVKAYCYPNGLLGDFTPESKEICKRLGYEVAFTSISTYVNSATDKYQIPRYGLNRASGLKRTIYISILPNAFINLIKGIKNKLLS